MLHLLWRFTILVTCYLSQYGDLGSMFFIPGARWLRLMRAQQLECWRLRAALFITPR